MLKDGPGEDGSRKKKAWICQRGVPETVGQPIQWQKGHKDNDLQSTTEN